MAPTPRQMELFHKLTTDRDFGDKNVDAVRTQFSNLTVKSASTWIDRAMSLPKVAENSEGADMEPGF